MIESTAADKAAAKEWARVSNLRKPTVSPTAEKACAEGMAMERARIVQKLRACGWDSVDVTSFANSIEVDEL